MHKETEMAILSNTEIRHDILGHIRFDNGIPADKHHHADGEQMWIARPNGWEGPGFEIYINGTVDAPQRCSLERAISALQALDWIAKQGIEISKDDIEITWIDCCKETTTVAFTHRAEVYELWQGCLDENNNIHDFTKGYW